MTLYERNLEALARSYPGMDGLIQSAREASEEDAEEEIILQEEQSIDGRRILKASKGEKTLYLNGRRDASDPAKRWAGSLGELQENAPIFLMGVGNETYLQELAESTKNRLAIVVYEPSLRIFLDFLEHTDLGKILRRHTLVFCVEGIRAMGFGYFKWMVGRLLNHEMLIFSRIFLLPNYEGLFPGEARAFLQTCRNTVVDEICNHNTRSLFADVNARNAFENLRHFPDCRKTTQLPPVIPKGIPGILVAAGPSLNKNIGELRRAKGKAFIIATDTAVKPLLSAGVVPDMFAIVDAKKPLSLVEVEEARGIPLLTTLNAACEVLDYHTGMKFFANEGISLVDRLFAKRDPIFFGSAAGGSVATTIFRLLYWAGIETVILVGQDLALTGNRTHADGTFEEKMPELDVSGCIMVEGNYEEKVPTRPDFQSFLNWYDEFIESCQKHDPNFRVINATEGGAKIKNTEIMTLREAIERECATEVDIPGCISSLRPFFEGEDREWVIGELRRMPESCRLLSEDAKKAVTLYRKLDMLCRRRKLDMRAYKKLIRRICAQARKVEGHDMYQLVVYTLNEAQDLIRYEQFLSYGTAQEEGIEVARKGILYMGVVSKCALAFQRYTESIYGDWDPNTSKLTEEDKK